MLHENKINSKEFEEKLHQELNRLGREIYAAVLENWDKEFHNTRDKKVYRDKGRRKTVLKTLMGEVEYWRYVYEYTDATGKSVTVHLLDAAMGKSDSGFFSEALVERIAISVCEMPYRKAAASISELTGQTISHGAVWNLTQKIGERVHATQEENAAKARQNKGSGGIETKLLFEEQDGIYLHLQGKARKEFGKGREMKLAIAYDGAKRKGKNRFELTNKIAYASFEEAGRFFRGKEGAIAAAYNVDEIQTRVVGGDGADWIKRSVGEDTIYQLDTFHRNRAVTRAAPDAASRNTMLKLLYSKEIEYLLVYIETLADSVEDESQAEALRELHKYFTNNAAGLIAYNRRRHPLPEPPEGKEYRRLGAIESNVFSVIGNRMKGRRKCWSITGGDNLASLLCLNVMGTLRKSVTALVGELPEKYAEEVITTLSAAKTKESAGKGYDGFDKATIPVTLKWLKGVAGIRPFSEIRV